MIQHNTVEITRFRGFCSTTLTTLLLIDNIKIIILRLDKDKITEYE